MADPQHLELIANVEGLIRSTFEIPAEEAHEQALGLVALATGWGGNRSERVDWDSIIKKRLGGAYKWRCEAELKKFKSDRESVYASYEQSIRKAKNS